MTLRLAMLVTATFLWLGAVFGLRKRRHWLLFYITGALGFILLALFWASALGLAEALEALEAEQALRLATALGIRLSIFGETGLAIENHTGWAVFDIGIECSALLEMSAMIGLTMWYPAFGRGRKVTTAVVGTTLTYLLNLARIMLIVLIIARFGSSWVFAAHAIFGRLFFFIGTVALYWRLLTRPTLGRVRADLEAVPVE